MIQNYLKIALRSLWRAKAHSTINVLGLGLGIACCILMVLFVRDEWTFDAFHTKANRIYRAYTKEDWGESQQFFNTSTPFPLGPTLKENFPDVEKEVRLLRSNPQVKVGENQFTERVTVAGQDFFDVFDFEITTGGKDALHQASSAVITRAIAGKYFGTENPVDKTISILLGENFEDFRIRAVVGEIPSNSSITFGILISDLNFPKLINPQALTSGWFNVNPETYVLLKEGTDVKKLLGQFPALFKTLIGEDYAKSKYTVGLQPLIEIHLDTSYPVAYAPVNDPKYAYILAAIAGLILLVACINFITLSVGRSIQRAREVGIRKVVGAARRQLIFQFVGEAIMVTIVALVLGLLISVLSLPLFNQLADKKLELLLDVFTTGLIGSLVIFIGLVAGSYPAFVLSGFKPITVLKGQVQKGVSKQGVRRVLVGVQLVLSIFLVTSTLIMQKQLEYLQNRDLGFNREQLMAIPLRVPNGGRLSERVRKGFEKAEQFKLELARYPGISSVCASAHDFGNGGWVALGYTDDRGTYRNFNLNVVDQQYLSTLRMTMVAGRAFSRDNPADERTAVIVNEAFVKDYNWKDILGKRIPGKKFQDHEIIGVVKDFNYASLYTKVQPLVLVLDPMIALSGAENINVDNSPIPKLLVRLRPGEIKETIKQIKSTWEKLSGEDEFAFSFVDQALSAQYQNDQNRSKIVSLATLLAILIGSSGLYGLASLAMQNRVKEISIRKVIGATQQSLLVLLSRDYVLLIFICLLISVPLTFYTMNQWLVSFEYKITIDSYPFIFAGSISMMIALFTVGYQVLKTAWTQPAETLKYE